LIGSQRAFEAFGAVDGYDLNFILSRVDAGRAGTNRFAPIT